MDIVALSYTYHCHEMSGTVVINNVASVAVNISCFWQTRRNIYSTRTCILWFIWIGSQIYHLLLLACSISFAKFTQIEPFPYMTQNYVWLSFFNWLVYTRIAAHTFHAVLACYWLLYMLSEEAECAWSISYFFSNVVTYLQISLQWRHNGRDSVSNHQPRDCLLNRLFRHRSKKTSKLRVIGFCAGNSPDRWIPRTNGQ